MRMSAKTALVLVKLLHVTLLSVVEAQQNKVQREEFGYIGKDVTLSCPPNKGSKLSQIEWKFKPPEGEEELVAVYSLQYGPALHNSSLRERVAVSNHSLTIKDVRITDKGVYTCEMALFPQGSEEETISLDVGEQMPMSSAMVPAIATVAVLLLVITAAIVYLIFIRRVRSSNMNHVHIDISGEGTDVASPSHTVRSEDVVYSNVKLKPTRHTSSSDRGTETAEADDVTYSEVGVMHPQHK